MHHHEEISKSRREKAQLGNAVCQQYIQSRRKKSQNEEVVESMVM